MAGGRSTHPNRAGVAGAAQAAEVAGVVNLPAGVEELAVGVPVRERHTYRMARHRWFLRRIRLRC